jgi:quercetin dioxygenase-like cupin family protein
MVSRKQFVQKGTLGFFSLLQFYQTIYSKNNYHNFEGLVVNEDEGETLQWRDGTSRIKIKISKIQGAGSVSFLSESFKPGDAIPLHKHMNEDELIFIHKGSGIFTLSEKEFKIAEGAVALVPKGIWHGLQNTGTENIEMRFAYAPAGFEGWFRELGTPVGQPFVKRTTEEKRVTAKKWGMIYKI